REVNRHDARPALHQIWRYTMRRAPARPNARRDLGASMSDTREHATRLLRAYQAPEKRLVERRLPPHVAPRGTPRGGSSRPRQGLSLESRDRHPVGSLRPRALLEGGT